MTQTYSTTPTLDSTEALTQIQEKMQDLGLPFPQNFARAFVGLLAGKKISLHEVANLMPGEQSLDANRQQIRRNLDHPTMQGDAWSRSIGALLPKKSWVLALDRTTWERGETVTNLLVLSVVVHECSVPLLWMVMPEAGNSDTAERIALMQQFLDIFGTARWRFLTADREFIGKEWISWLLEKKLSFRIRIKAGEFLTHWDGRRLRACEFFGQQGCRCKPRRMKLWGLDVFVGGKRLYHDNFLIVISSHFVNDSTQDVLSQYRLRWKIETLFQALKGRGFDLESCRLSQEKRLSGWFGFLALGLCWCLKVGTLLDEQFALPLKNHGRRAESVFHRGVLELQIHLCRVAGRRGALSLDRLLQELNPVC
nr:IS4 family transposase [Armatimonas sp.]